MKMPVKTGKTVAITTPKIFPVKNIPIISVRIVIASIKITLKKLILGLCITSSVRPKNLSTGKSSAKIINIRRTSGARLLTYLSPPSTRII
jgi:hypothetical protein